jgi:hypothetical protein
LKSVLKKIALYTFLAAVVPLAMLELAARFLPVSSPPYLLPVSAQHPVPRFQPDVQYQYSWGPDFAVRSVKRSNNFGYAHFADYKARDDSPLLMVIGDSFVEAQAIDSGKSAAELLHASLGGTGRVYSIGVSGAPLSQYLVFAQYAAREFRPDAMAFFIISNDFDESLIQYKSEPRFHYFEEGPSGVRLRRVDYRLSAAKKVLRHSALLRYLMYNVALEARLQAILNPGSVAAWGARDGEPPERLERRVRDSRRAVDHFLALLPEMSGLGAGSIVFVLDAVRPAIYSEQGLEAAERGYHARLREYFAARAKAQGYEVVDMQPAFIARHRADGSRFEFPSDSHWNELGNALVAEELAKTPVFGRVFRSPELLRATAPKGLRRRAERRTRIP